jgi:uncharacterized protein
MIRDATADDFDAILALNAESVQVLSPLDRPRLKLLHEMSACRKVALSRRRVTAFLLAMREGQEYDSPNYRWFAARLPSFLYVDRIVVSPDARQTGLGSRLYGHAFECARAGGALQLACEISLDPPNPASQLFHARHGFREVGTQWLDAGEKTGEKTGEKKGENKGKKKVSMQARDVPSF